MKKFHELIIFSALTAIIVLSIASCGKQPTEPPPLIFGSLEIYACYDSTWVDSLGETHTVQVSIPNIEVTIDDDIANMVAGATPVIIDSLVPGEHYVYVEWGQFTNTFMASIEPGVTTTVNPTLTQFAPDFTAPAVHYDTTSMSMVQLPGISLSDYAGEIVLLFYFGAG